jgi:hypothetical protein
MHTCTFYSWRIKHLMSFNSEMAKYTWTAKWYVNFQQNGYITVFLLYLFNICTIHIKNICPLRHCYMFRCLYIILMESLIVYTKVTKLIKWKHLYKWLLLLINRLKLWKILYDISGCLQFLKCLSNRGQQAITI